MMTHDPDDPRFTAYALNELEGEERAVVETLLSGSDDARRLVEEIQALAHLLSDQLKHEPTPGLFPEQRGAIEAKTQHPPRTLAVLPVWSRVLRYGIAAGALALVSGSTYIVWQSRQRQLQHPVLADFESSPRAKSVAPDFEPALSSGASVGIEVSPAPPSGKKLSVDHSPQRDSLERYSLETKPGNNMNLSFDALPASPNNLPAAGLPAAVAKLEESSRPDHYYSLKTDSAESPPGSVPAISAASPGTQPAGDVRSLKSAAATESKSRFGDLSDGMSVVPSGVVSAGGSNRGFTTGPQRGADRLEDLQQGQVAGLAPADGGLNRNESEGIVLLGRRVKEKLTDEAADSFMQSGQGVAPQEPGGKPELAVTELSLIQRGEAARSPAAAGAGGIETLRKRQDTIWSFRANAAQYAPIVENAMKAVTTDQNLSTFAIDVDTASYSNMRRYLAQDGALPPPDAIRIEELLNYFTYDYPEPSGDTPFSVDTEVTRCPWNPAHWLLRIGLRGRSIAFENRKPANLVFLVDASGSMDQPAKMPLVKAGLRMLVDQLGENDKLSIVTYANGSGVALPPTIGFHKPEILTAIDQIRAGGSTNGAAGINTAYELAKQNFIAGGINRLILATDGDFNVGVTDQGSLTRMAEEHAKSGVFLSAFGFGSDNLKDATLEQIADKGNGQYGYIDSLLEARKNFVEEVGGTLVTIAKDVKIQVDFNPAKVGAYRQIGYENRVMAHEDFRNDAKDAGEIGSGHTVTALYELIPVGEESALLAAKLPASDFVKPAELAEGAKQSDKLLTVRLRYKQPEGDTATEFEQPVKQELKDLGQASSDTKFASAVAMFGMLLRNSKYLPADTSVDAVLELADGNRGRDPGGYRAEFIELIKKTKAIITPQP
jgi:Ca-activated chloride channel family protein